MFDISLTREGGSLRGSGQDFAQLVDVHEGRSQRAQTLDEKKTAQPTRDPIQWVNSPGRYDYPGIDTVDPKKLHGQRSKQAQTQDERELAPITNDRQK